MKRQKLFKSNSKRRMMLKKVHQRVLLRRKQYTLNETEADFQEVF